jgi:hypothetical protein
MLLSEVVLLRVGRKQEGEKDVADDVSSKSAEWNPTPPTTSLQFFSKTASNCNTRPLLVAFFVRLLLIRFIPS